MPFKYKFNELPSINFPKTAKVLQFNSLTINGNTETVKIIGRLEFCNEIYYYLEDERIIHCEQGNYLGEETISVYQKGKRIIQADSFLYISSKEPE